MVKKAKHQFHCQYCGDPCEIYKKGKKHRVLVCPQCGVLATNPFSVRKALKGVAKTVPVLSQVVGATEGFSSKSPRQTSQTTPRSPRHDNSLEKIKYALGGK